MNKKILERLNPDNMNLRRFISIVLVLGLLIPSVFSGYILISNDKRDHIERREHFHRTILSLGAAAIETPLWELRKNSAMEALSPIIDDERVHFVKVKDLQTGDNFIDYSAGKVPPGVNILNKTKVIYRNNKPLGEMTIGISDKYMGEVVKEDRNLLFMSFFMQMIFSLLLLLAALHRKVISPVKRLTEEANILSANKLDEPFIWYRKDEMGKLGRTFEYARSSISEILKDIENKREKLANIIEGTNVGTWEWNVQTGEVSFNENWANIIGYNLDELEPVSIDTWIKFAHPDDFKESEKLLKKHFEGELDYYHFESRMLHREGHYIWVLDRGKVSKWTEDGKPLVMSGSHQDITERKQAEEALQENKENFRQLFENMSSGVAVYEAVDAGENFVFVDFNKAAEEIENCDREDVIGNRLTEVFPGVEEFGLFEVFKEVWNTGESQYYPATIYEDERIAGWRENWVYKLPSGLIVAVYNDITERKISEERLMESEEKFRKIIETTPDGFFSVNTEGKFVYVNDAYCKMVGYSAEDLLQMSIPDVENIEKPEDTEKHIKIVMEKGFDKFETQHIKRNGDIVDIEISVAVINLNEPLLVVFARDVTERNKFQNALSLAKEQAEAANIAKSEFLANISHEIRTPMNAIIGLSDLLSDTDLDYKQKDYTNKINNSSKLLLGIINDILDYSKIEAGKLELEKREFQMDKVFSQLKTLFSKTIADKNLDLFFFIDPEVPEYLIGDALRLQQILSNLVSNAVKFTDKGHIKLSISIREIEKNFVTLDFRVEDTGTGMSDEQKEKLFKSFSQVDSSITRKYGGTGLGLVIVKRIIEAMGGDIDVKSRENEGSVFSFYIKLEYNDKKESKFGNAFRDDYDVLVVDDQEISREVLKSLLKRLKCNIEEAESGKEALEKILNMDKQPDCILMDWNMPEMDGVQTIKEIEGYYEANKLSGFPPTVLMISAYSEDDIDTSGINLSGFLPKPVTASSLMDSMVGVSSGADKTDTVLNVVKDFDFSYLNILLVEDNIINMDVAYSMLEKTGASITCAYNGKESVDIVFSGKSFDIILMDIQMPVMSGYDAAVEIKKINKNVPVIALTAAAMVEDRRKVLQSGMDDHLSKPIEKIHLYEKIAYWCKIDIKGNYQKDYPVHSDKESVLDLEYSEKVIGDKDLINKLYCTLLEQLNSTFADVADKVSNNDSSAPYIIHSLKGACGNIGAGALANICKKIDDKYKNNEYIPKEYNESLEWEINLLKVELEKICRDQKNYEDKIEISEDELRVIFNTIKTSLENSEVVDGKHVQKLFYGLEKLVDQKELDNWYSFIDSFDYDAALEVMNKWNI